MKRREAIARMGDMLLSTNIVFHIVGGITVKKAAAGTREQVDFTPEMPDATIPSHLGQLPNKAKAYEHRYEVTMQNSNDPFYFGVRGNSENLIPSYQIIPGATQGRYFVNVRFSTLDVDSDENIEIVFSDEPVSIAEPKDRIIPQQHELVMNYPNPFNPATRVKYRLTHSDDVQIRIYDGAARLIRKYECTNQTAGMHEWLWDGRNAQGRDAASGIYIIELRTPKFRQALRAVKLK